jgi:hypothetical protein
VKVAPALVDKIDLTDTDVLSADKGYDSKALREQKEHQQKQIFQRNPTHFLTIIIWIGTYIKSET